MASTAAGAAELRRHAAMDVREGARWAGARVPVELELAERHLRITVRGFGRHGRRERLALQRLVGPEGLGELNARDELTIEVPLAGGAIAFSRLPGLRSAILVQLDGRPAAALSFADVSGLRGVEGGAAPWSGLIRLIASFPAAKRARTAWRAEIERRARSLRPG